MIERGPNDSAATGTDMGGSNARILNMFPGSVAAASAVDVAPAEEAHYYVTIIIILAHSTKPQKKNNIVTANGIYSVLNVPQKATA